MHLRQARLRKQQLWCVEPLCAQAFIYMQESAQLRKVLGGSAAAANYDIALGHVLHRGQLCNTPLHALHNKTSYKSSLHG